MLASGSGQRPDHEGEREFREGEEQNLPLTNRLPWLYCPTGQTYGIRRGLGCKPYVLGKNLSASL